MYMANMHHYIHNVLHVQMYGETINPDTNIYTFANNFSYMYHDTGKCSNILELALY